MKTRSPSDFGFVERYKWADECPEYKTIEQYEMFIDVRKEDIRNIKKAIRQAKLEIAKRKANDICANLIRWFI